MVIVNFKPCRAFVNYTMTEESSRMYMGHKGKNNYSAEWLDKTNHFVEQAFSRADARGVLFPCVAE